MVCCIQSYSHVEVFNGRIFFKRHQYFFLVTVKFPVSDKAHDSHVGIYFVYVSYKQAFENYFCRWLNLSHGRDWIILKKKVKKHSRNYQNHEATLYNYYSLQ